VILVVTLATYAAALRAGFVWDDDAHVIAVTADATLRTVDGLRRIWFDPGATAQYYPLVFTSFWVEHGLWGSAAAGYHAVNILLHAANAILVWRILRRLGVPACWLVGLVFAVHPVHVESVAWVTERKNVLSAFFYLLAMRAYLRFALGARDEDPSTGRSADRPAAATIQPVARAGRPWRYYAAALLLFAAALLSKTVTCSLPAAILLILWWKRGRIGARDVWPLVPFFALGGALAAITIHLERHDIGAVGDEWNLSGVQRVLIAGRAVWFYAFKLVWPVGLAFIYPRWTIDAGAWWQFTYPAGVIAVIAGLWLARGRIGRGPLVAVLCFVGTLVPALGFFDVYPMRFSFVADHFQYLASPGLLTLIVAGWAAYARGLERRAALRRALAGVVVLLLAVLSWRQIRAYESAEALWRDTLSKNPESWMVNYNLGQLLEDSGRTGDAVPYYEAALRAKPDHVRSLSNLGRILASAGALQRAVELLARAAELDPASAAVQQNLGALYGRLGRHEDAARHFTEAVRLDPSLVHAHVNLAATLLALDRREEAIDVLVELMRSRPDTIATLTRPPNVRLLDAIAGAYARTGQYGVAVAHAIRARDLAQQAGQAELAAAIARRIEEYKAQRDR
jgi:tetratricopeptide (TPR) repeat protein